MVLPYTLNILRVIVIVVVTCTGWSFAEKRLLCSSESGSIWYDFEGPLYLFSASISPCYIGMHEINLNFLLIPMFTIKLLGYHTSILYKNKQWMEFSEPVGSCAGFKVCHILKGETIEESVPLRFRMAPGIELKGDYYVLVRINIIDDFERELVVTGNLTVHINSR